MPTKFDELREKHTRVLSEIKQDGRDAFVDFFSEHFQNIQGLEAIRWKQYTPYFNDGDPCAFNVYELQVKFENQNNGGDYNDGYYQCSSIRESIHEHNHLEWIEWSSGMKYEEYGLFIDKSRFQKFDEMRKGVRNIPDNLFLLSFGDHASIHCKIQEDRLVITVKEYEHD